MMPCKIGNHPDTAQENRKLLCIRIYLSIKKKFMKVFFVFATLVGTGLFAPHLFAQSSKAQASLSTQSKNESTSKNLYLDVHHLGAGKVTAKDVEAAHQKDLAAQKKYGVSMIKYWFDEANGNVYCLASSPDTESIIKTHAEAHGLLPDQIHLVTAGQDETIKGNNNLYLDIHELGPEKATAKDVAAAHQKDLAVQKKYGVNLINYWFDEQKGTVMCLAQAPDSSALINTHKEAHGLVPLSVVKVKQGQ
jgi:hypothetical protein